MRFRYFVSFVCRRWYGYEIGNSDFVLRSPISTYDDVVRLERQIAVRNQFKGVTVLNFRRYDVGCDEGCHG